MSKLPRNFGYLSQMSPGIRQSIRYYSDQNFLGKRLNGYQHPDVVLQLKTIEALNEAQKAANTLGYDLLVYDGYRPKRAVEELFHWTEGSKCENAMYYYPNLQKSELKTLGYISCNNMEHCSGLAVDITIIRRDRQLSKNITWSYRSYNGHQVPFGNDGSADMYTSYLLFDEASHHDSPWVPPAYIEKRNCLKYIMESSDFKSYEKEWWHYCLSSNNSYHEIYDFIY